MKDLYLELSHSQLGKSLFEALSLPNPPELHRSPDQSLSLPKGQVLIAGSKHAQLLKTVVSVLDADGISLCSPVYEGELNQTLSKHRKAKRTQNIHEVSLNSDSNQRYRFVIFDASGIKNINDLSALHLFFNSALPHLKRNGRVIVLSNTPKDNDQAFEHSVRGGLEGFVKSVSKEIGKKGASCNLLYAESPNERQLRAPLAFLLSEKSCFITGQSIYAANGSATMARNIDWSKPLSNKVALVTGAAQGIGAETAKILARDGAKVVCLDIPQNQHKLNALAEQIDGFALPLDLSVDNAPQTLATQVASQLGVIDIVIHNAGITRDKTLARMPQHFWDQAIDINLNKIIDIDQTLLSKNLINPRGRVICVSSISGIAGNFGQSNYALSKAGIAAYVKRQATVADKGITYNAVAPGFIETDMTGKVPAITRQIGRRTNAFGQGGLPLDVAETIALFCHPAAQSLNGNVLRVCGQSILGR